MDRDYDVVLRGHHLCLLYDYCFLFNEDYTHGENYIRYNLSNSYGEEHTNYTMSILKNIAESDNIRIKLVSDVLDDICEKCCRTKHKFKLELCNSNGGDLRAIANIGLRADEVYTSKHILEKLKMFWEERSERILEI